MLSKRGFIAYNKSCMRRVNNAPKDVTSLMDGNVPRQQQQWTVEHSPKNLVERALTALRKNSLNNIPAIICTSEVVPKNYRSERLLMEDGSMLSPYAHIFDVGARRLLPRNLLRRSRVLGALPSESGRYQIRMAVTSKSGEEGVLVWELANRSSSAAKAMWCLERVVREREEHTTPLPTTPHPRVSPESILLSFLKHIRELDVTQALSFCVGNPIMDAISQHQQSPLSSLDISLDPEKRKDLLEALELYPYCVLKSYTEIVLGEGLLLNQRHMVQEIFLHTSPRSNSVNSLDSFPSWVRFIWHVKLQKHACWMIDKIEYIDDE